MKTLKLSPHSLLLVAPSPFYTRSSNNWLYGTFFSLVLIREVFLFQTCRWPSIYIVILEKMSPLKIAINALSYLNLMRYGFKNFREGGLGNFPSLGRQRNLQIPWIWKWFFFLYIMFVKYRGLGVIFHLPNLVGVWLL